MRVARRASACALPRPSASASARLAKTTVSQSQIATVKVNHAGSSPPPSGAPPKTWISQPTVVTSGADLDDEHHRVADLHARVELAQARGQRRPQDRAVEERARRSRFGHRAASSVEGEVELEHVDAGLAEEAERAAVGVVVDQLQDALERDAADLGDAVRLDPGVGLRDVRVDAGGRGRDRVDRDVAAVRPGL